MSAGMPGRFAINAHLIGIKEAIREKSEAVFLEKGIAGQYFNIESLKAPETDDQELGEAKERKSKRFG